MQRHFWNMFNIILFNVIVFYYLMWLWKMTGQNIIGTMYIVHCTTKSIRLISPLQGYFSLLCSICQNCLGCLWNNVGLRLNLWIFNLLTRTVKSQEVGVQKRESCRVNTPKIFPGAQCNIFPFTGVCGVTSRAVGISEEQIEMGLKACGLD